MKVFITAIVIFCLLISINIIYYNYLDYSTSKISNKIDEINYNTNNNRLELSEQLLNELRFYWDENEKWIEMLVEHYEIDNIKSLFVELSACYKYNDFQNFFITSSKLKYYILHLKEKNKFSLENLY